MRLKRSVEMDLLGNLYNVASLSKVRFPLQVSDDQGKLAYSNESGIAMGSSILRQHKLKRSSQMRNIQINEFTPQPSMRPVLQ